MANTTMKIMRKIAKGLRILTRNFPVLGSVRWIIIPIVKGTINTMAKLAIFIYGIFNLASSMIVAPRVRIQRGIMTTN